MKYSMNISKDPPAVRRQDKFAKKEEERMLRFCARVSGQPGLRVVAKGDLNAFESGRAALLSSNSHARECALFACSRRAATDASRWRVACQCAGV
jgi:hypothetical protein